MKNLTHITSKFILRSLLTLLFVCSSLVTIAQVSPQERQALVDLYNATDGDNWANTLAGNRPWLINDSNSPVNDWYGVTVNAGKVTKLSL